MPENMTLDESLLGVEYGREQFNLRAKTDELSVLMYCTCCTRRACSLGGINQVQIEEQKLVAKKSQVTGGSLQDFVH